MQFLEADTLDQVQYATVKALLEHGRSVHPRGMSVQEITPLAFRLHKPRARLIYSPARHLSLMFAAGELAWYLRGANELDIISFYNKRYHSFSDDGTTLHGAYGRRLFTDSVNGFVQWNSVYQLLLTDPDTRQAVMHLHAPHDLTVASRDVPCTCYIQFFIREGRLECIVNMRSNDIIWGTGYDVFSFTMMQEIMARQLGIELGPYTHFAGSMHLYDRHLDLAKQILAEAPSPVCEMPRMPENPWAGIKQLLQAEEDLRLTGTSDRWPEHKYWQHFAQILQGHAAWRRKDFATMNFVSQQLPSYYQRLMPRRTMTVS